VLHLYRGGTGELASDRATYRQAHAMIVIIFMLYISEIFWFITRHGYWSTDYSLVVWATNGVVHGRELSNRDYWCAGRDLRAFFDGLFPALGPDVGKEDPGVPLIKIFEFSLLRKSVTTRDSFCSSSRLPTPMQPPPGGFPSSHERNLSVRPSSRDCLT
jgi:hypothetical protein